ncbi:D-lactate dehydrogenase (cytochrome) [Fusarium agapanthi]|uniref:D-lactate dehydrogenase (Cytochrome) n=1 Tax=Fusarium agapanthi TaxID=1803897 RepID=A0A9P5B656_9HYPO|nr:D-lactate dehydrogenase (cytochrome) [Fusarium agapanthi]
MMALAVEVKTSAPKSDEIFVKIRPGLLALKQFESVYILARWIKNFFMDILNRPAPFDAAEMQRSPLILHGDDTTGGGTGSETVDGTDEIPTTTTSAGQATHDVTSFEDSNFGFEQNSGFEGGGFWPTYLANGVFSGVQSSDDKEFPRPDSFQYQAIHLYLSPKTRCDLPKLLCRLYTNLYGGYYMLGHVQRLPGLDYQLSAFDQLRTRQRRQLQDHNGRKVVEARLYAMGMAALTVGMAGALSVSSQPTKTHLSSTQALIGTPEIQHGLFFPPDPGPGATIGGMVGTGCSGTNAAAYGTMKDWVLSLTVVLADGTIIKTRQRARKSSAGYDLTRTFIGSEGTLGLVTEATLKLAAASAAREVLSNGIQVAAVEILDEVQMKSISDSALTRLKWKEKPTLFFKFTGSDEFIVQHLAKQVGIITKQNHSTEELAMRKSPTDKAWTTDVAIPLSRLPDIIEFAKADIEKSGSLGSIVGHVGDGNFHTLLLFPEEKRHIAEDVVHRMVDKAIEMKGTATGEHGVGLVKRDYLEKEIGKEAVDAIR